MPARGAARSLWQLAGVMALLCFALLPERAAAQQPARFMQSVANELMNAASGASANAFHEVFKRHADLPSIGLYSLGSYANSLSREDRDPFYSGMVGFIARYAASQAPQYPVERMVVVGQTEETRTGVYVDTVVYLKGGGSYEVRWWLIRRSGTFKVGDVQVLGVWGREELKRLFEGYISQNGGNPKALLLALNR
ncbi:MAG: ABC transporter substrate-binding protein [Hyphomicrobiaceae bacterium]|nr:ABC transporter substrate-binding protein [Hyphomicrobiaceae bacterium]